MDTEAENEIQTTMGSSVLLQNGFTNEITNGINNGLTNGITNGAMHSEEQKTVLEIKSESKNSVVTSVSKPSVDTMMQGSMLRKDVFYPYQKSMYVSPSYNLSSDSKRMIRRLQEPIFAASPGTVHLVYEVGGLMTEILLKALSLLSICIFWYALCSFFSLVYKSSHQYVTLVRISANISNAFPAIAAFQTNRMIKRIR